MPLYVNPSFLFVIWDFDELSLNVTDMTKSANVFCKPFYVTYFEISQNWLEIMWFKGCSYGLSLICPWQLNWYWKWQHLSFFVPFIKPLYPLYQTPLSPFAEGYQLPSGFTNDSYLIFFSPTTNSVHLGQSCFIRCSFFARLSHKESRAGILHICSLFSWRHAHNLQISTNFQVVFWIL